ncbi:MAG: hypothetical protein ACP5MG_09905 [Verrucomicrobiia bacterium]|jgi:hypothetical protein
MKSLHSSKISRRQFLRRTSVTSGGALLMSGLTQIGFSKTSDDPILPKIQPFIQENSIAGAVMLIASNEKIIYENAVGFADIALRKPMKTDALFWMVQHNGFIKNGGEAFNTFKKNALEVFKNAL